MVMMIIIMVMIMVMMMMTTLGKSQWQGPSNESGLSVYWAIGNQTDQKPDDDDDGGGDGGGGGGDDDDDDLQADGGVLMVQIRDRNENISVGISALFTLFIRIGIFVQILNILKIISI